MSGKFALIIGNTEYTDPGLAQLSAPGKDAEDFARVLKEPKLCAFDDARTTLNQPSSSVIEAIDEFFDQRKPDDLLVLYFSGHGIRDEFGALYLAFRNTIRTRLRSTAIKADYIREAMDQSRSKRQILILDCCNSGAFAQGTKAEVGGSMGMMTAFQGYGRYVLTASDATQFAWEGDRFIGKTENSLFTHFLVKGLEGDADLDGDGRISVDNLYDYAFDEISKVTPSQTPTKSASTQAGDIILRQITRMEDIKAIALPDDLEQALEDPRPFVREGAAEQLEALLHGKNLGRARSAKEALEKLAAEDDSFRVRQTAARALGPLMQPAPQTQEAKAAENVTPVAAEVQKMESAPAPIDVQKIESGPAPIEVQSAESDPTPPASDESVQLLPPVVEPAMSNQPPAAPPEKKPTQMPSLNLSPWRLVAGVVGVLLVIVVAVVLLRPHPASPADQGPTALATVPTSAQQIAGVPITGSPQATALSTVASTTEGSRTLPPTSIAPGTHLVKPSDAALPKASLIYDADSSGTGPQGRAPYGDSYQANRFERPFEKGMTYVSDLDVLSFSLSQDSTWNYVSMQLAGSNPNDPLGIDYGVEIDLNDDGYGDYLIWAHAPYATAWQTTGVQVYKDTNHDTGGVTNSSDSVVAGNGYDTLVFNGGTSQDTDPDMAWVRMVGSSHASVQFAFKRSAIGSSFLYGVVADAGLKDVSKFDYRFQFTQAQAGSPVRGNRYYPLVSLYALDNTCWQPNGIPTTGSELKVCPVQPQQSTNKGSHSSCSPIPACGPAGYDPVTCQCK